MAGKTSKKGSDTYCWRDSNFDSFKLKGTVSVISGDSPCKDGNALFTMVPLQP